MSDIVERLRERARKARQVANEFFNGARPLEGDPIDTLCEDAIAEIERHQAELREARERLKPFAEAFSLSLDLCKTRTLGDIEAMAARHTPGGSWQRAASFLAKVQP